MRCYLGGAPGLTLRHPVSDVAGCNRRLTTDVCRIATVVSLPVEVCGASVQVAGRGRRRGSAEGDVFVPVEVGVALADSLGGSCCVLRVPVYGGGGGFG